MFFVRYFKIEMLKSYKIIHSDYIGQRLDNYLIRILKGVPKSHIYKIIRIGLVRVNKKKVNVSLRLSYKDEIQVSSVYFTEKKKNNIFINYQIKYSLSKSVIFENDQLLVINKPSNLAVHGGSGLCIGVIEALREIRKDLFYLNLIHRLDKETSGCLLISKKRSVSKYIGKLLEDRKVKKVYLALLLNTWKHPDTVSVNVRLKKVRTRFGKKIIISKKLGKYSLTMFYLLENYQNACLVKIIPKTGRTHQIRVHSSYLGNPIIGDKKYGNMFLDTLKTINFSIDRLYLHAESISFTIDKKFYKFQSLLDKNFFRLLKEFRSSNFYFNS
ncbi:RluA family pseudouridine synthase [Candidatus Legionella polyplacis]|uniref:Pseudouridine synthase n=1 Tax=Candidatus Legionella polyplacis TaxID=2005262 RepID=A0ABZ2H0C0_9GAMM